MSSGEVDYRQLFAACGRDVVVEPGVYIEHPERWVVGDGVRFMRGFVAVGQQAEVRLGQRVIFYPNVFIQGSGRLLVGDDVTFYPQNYLSIGGAAGLIEIGSRTHFAPGCALYGAGGLRIGPCCAVAAHTVITTIGHDHRRVDRPMVEGSRAAPITLVRDIWIGANATVLGGVTVAEGCVIAAGAVLTRDTQPYGVYMGVPARLAYFRRVPEAAPRAAEGAAEGASGPGAG